MILLCSKFTPQNQVSNLSPQHKDYDSSAHPTLLLNLKKNFIIKNWKLVFLVRSESKMNQKKFLVLITITFVPKFSINSW